MLTIRGVYLKTVFRDNKTGKTGFWLKTKDVVPGSISDLLYCYGIFPAYPLLAPIELQGDAIVQQDNNRVLFSVQNIKMCFYSKDETINFLASKAIKGIGKRRAKKLWDRYTYSITECVAGEYEKSDIQDILPENTYLNLQATIHGIQIRSAFHEYIQSIGLSFEAEEFIYNTHKGKSLSIALENPYIFVDAGVPFLYCEKLAENLAIEQYSPNRLCALAEAGLLHIEANGSSNASLRELQKAWSSIEAPRWEEKTNWFCLIGELNDKKRYIWEKTDQGTVIYRKTTWEMENAAAEHTKRLLSHKKKMFSYENTIQQVEENLNVHYSKEQESAFSLLDSTGIKVLTGGPGTGKTTVICGLINAYRKVKSTASIILTAPTGCAVKRIEDATGCQASTVHRLLKVIQTENGMLQMKNEADQIDADLLIVDESSMINTEMYGRLLSALKNRATVIFVGDEDQLPAIGIGNTLHELKKMEGVEYCRLQQLFRQDTASTIPANAQRILEGNRPQPSDDFHVYQTSFTEETIETTKAITKNLLKKYESVRVYTTAVRGKFPVNVGRLNKELKPFFVTDSCGNKIYSGNAAFTVGDQILFTRNNYDPENPYYNGDEGVVREVCTEDDHTGLVIELDSKKLFISGDLLKDITHAYARTIHKAQGSECDAAVVVLPESPASLLNRNEVYTACSRAKKECIIISENKALDIALENKNAHIRHNGLARKVSGEKPIDPYPIKYEQLSLDFLV